MRLDKFVSNNTKLSRKEASLQIKLGNVSVNGEKILTPDFKVDENLSKVCLFDAQIKYSKFTYIMLNKPQGVVSATTDSKEKTVLDLLPDEYKKSNLFPCGRLDKDTLGLVILTNNGQGAHKLLSPKNHIKKIYEFECADQLTLENKQKIEQGITLKDGYTTKPCNITMNSGTFGTITLTEGKYHEIKRMFGAVGNKITFLKRVSFGSIQLDKTLNYGEFRHLTKQEQSIFE